MNKDNISSKLYIFGKTNKCSYNFVCAQNLSQISKWMVKIARVRILNIEVEVGN